MEVVNVYIAYETGLWPFHVDLDFTLKNSLFGAVRLTKNSVQIFLLWYWICRNFSLSDGNGLEKKVIIFSVDLSLPVHVDYKTNFILILIKAPTQGLHNTILTAEIEHSTHFRERHNKFFKACVTVG